MPDRFAEEMPPKKIPRDSIRKRLPGMNHSH